MSDPKRILFPDYIAAHPNEFVKTNSDGTGYTTSAGGGGGLDYDVYTALISQIGTDAPTVTILGTNTIGAIVWTRANPGIYVGTLSGAFTENKTFFIPPNLNEAGFVRVQRLSANQIGILTNGIDNLPADSLLTLSSFQIMVYP